METNYRELYEAIWQFHKRNIRKVDNSDEFWDTIKDEALQISKDFDGHPLIRALIIFEWDEFARVLAQQKEDTKESNSEEKDRPP